MEKQHDYADVDLIGRNEFGKMIDKKLEGVKTN